MLLDVVMDRLWREGIQPSLAPIGAFLRNPDQRARRRAGKAECLPPKARLVPAVVVPVAKALLFGPRGRMLVDRLWREGILPSLAPTGAFLRSPDRRA